MHGNTITMINAIYKTAKYGLTFVSFSLWSYGYYVVTQSITQNERATVYIIQEELYRSSKHMEPIHNGSQLPFSCVTIYVHTLDHCLHYIADMQP